MSFLDAAFGDIAAAHQAHQAQTFGEIKASALQQRTRTPSTPIYPQPVTAGGTYLVIVDQGTPVQVLYPIQQQGELVRVRISPGVRWATPDGAPTAAPPERVGWLSVTALEQRAPSVFKKAADTTRGIPRHIAERMITDVPEEGDEEGSGAFKWIVGGLVAAGAYVAIRRLRR